MKNQEFQDSLDLDGDEVAELVSIRFGRSGESETVTFSVSTQEDGTGIYEEVASETIQSGWDFLGNSGPWASVTGWDLTGDGQDEAVLCYWTVPGNYLQAAAAVLSAQPDGWLLLLLERTSSVEESLWRVRGSWWRKTGNGLLEIASSR